jgi:phage terminase small subunit
MANTKKRLTAKEQKLVHEYIRIGNITQAAIIAGYPKRSASSVGSDVLKKPDVKAYYDKQMAELARDSIMGAREALELLTSIARGETKEEVVAQTMDGYSLVNKRADIKDRLTATKEILKRYPESDQLELVKLEGMRLENELKQRKLQEESAGEQLTINFVGFDNEDNNA